MILEAVPNIGYFLIALALISYLLFFMTTLEMGSFVLAMLSANGSQQPGLLLRLFWLVVEGIITSVIIHGGLESMQSAGEIKILLWV